ncbi:flagellar protein FlbB [Azospirillaceae bacterium]
MTRRRTSAIIQVRAKQFRATFLDAFERDALLRGAARRREGFGMNRKLRARFGFRLLPITIFAAILMLGVRVGDLWQSAIRGGQIPGVASLKAESLSTTPPTQIAEASTPNNASSKPAGAQQAKATAKAGAAAAQPPAPITPQNAALAPDGIGAIDLAVMQNIAKRREALEQRERDIDQREKLLVVTEKRLDQKVSELQSLRSEIQGLLKVADDRQKAQMESLVKIYETMKPKEAARIFEALDQPILLSVIERMKEVKTAAILAAMDPIKAKEVTSALAERRQLPQLPILQQ